MSDAPERIWTWDETNCTDKNPHNKFTTEYIRADLAAPDLAELVEALQAFKDFDDMPTEAKRPDVFELRVRQPILAALAKIKEPQHG